MNGLKITFISEIFSAYVSHYKTKPICGGFLVGTHCHITKCISNFLEIETGACFSFFSVEYP